MKNLEVGTKVDFYEVVSYKNGVYVLDDGYNKVTVDMEAKKIAFVEKNNRCFKATRYTKSFNFLINSIEELEAEEAEEAEEVENLNDDLFQESDIAYAEEAIEREANEKVKIHIYQEVIEETGYNETEIKRQIVRQLIQQPSRNFILNEYKIITLQNGERVEIFPFFTIKNQLIITVKYW